jgi:hypothetical protein
MEVKGAPKKALVYQKVGKNPTQIPTSSSTADGMKMIPLLSGHM